MRRIACLSCLSAIVLLSFLTEVAAADPKTRVLCDKADPKNKCPGVDCVCLDDSFEVTFDGGTQSIFEYATFEQDKALSIVVVMDVKTAGPEPGKGVQGWSYGVAHDQTALEITSATTKGTDAADLFATQFDATSAKDIETCTDGSACKTRTAGGGFISAVVLSLTSAVDLPVKRNSIAKADYKLLKDVGSQGTLLSATGLLAKKKSPPADLNMTVNGLSRKWSVGIDGWVKKIDVPPETNCTDGVDNDGDQKIDCADTDCVGKNGCEAGPETKCNDTIDNDGDQKIDCADDDCTPQCQTGKGFNLILNAPGAVREGDTNKLTLAGDPVGQVIELTAYAGPAGEPESEGPQGWSISVHHIKETLEVKNGDGFPTIDGTDAGALFNGGFQKTEVVDPTKNGGKAGFVSAVVLALTENVTLDPTKEQSIARSKYTVLASPTFPTSIVLLDGLKGKGQPVPNVLTVKGDTVVAKKLIPLQIDAGSPPPKSKFIRGDANDDAKVNIADPIWIINELVRQGPATKCKSAADANDDGLEDLSDASYLIQWRFLGGTAPKAPWPACGDDTTLDSLPCPKGVVTHCP